MRANLLISWRYLITKRKEKFLSLISIISILGIAIGVMALIVVIGVMSGFDKDLRDRIIGNYAHITVSSYRPMDYADFESIAEKLKAEPHIRGLSPYLQGQVLIEENNKFMALGIKGIDPAKEKKVTRLERYMVKGSLAGLKEDTVIIGKELALYLGLVPGSELNIYSPLGKQYKLTVSGVFNSGMYDYDLNLIIVGLATTQKILGAQNQISAIAVKLDDLYLADKLKKRIAGLVGYDYSLKTWMEANQNFFAALKLEKLTMFIILTLIILVASFNIISTLVVLVVEKTKDIGVLKSIGMSESNIRKIFTYEGLIIGSLGTVIGTLGGLVICGLLKKYQFIKLPQDIYYIDSLPVALEIWPDLILISAAAMGITMLATIYPALKASQMKPVEALRYE
ncbi:MAG: ABC transporter permease [Candidatus Omnitrophica bacterium]|jgi:lipoprotein-releasing system permease protein|nr:ABC transporter permease [Candidatus Omnitrophota bacterium]MDD5079656.1 ABC transporter permease [Candidatus Omnitrophota bacterium]